MQESVANQIQKEIQDIFIWTSDREKDPWGEHWDDRSDDYLDGRLDILRDDCDTCAITKAGVANKKYGIPATLIQLCKVVTERGTHHLVCVVGGWVLDNRYPWVYRIGEKGYEWRNHCYYANLSQWYKTVLVP